MITESKLDWLKDYIIVHGEVRTINGCDVLYYRFTSLDSDVEELLLPGLKMLLKEEAILRYGKVPEIVDTMEHAYNITFFRLHDERDDFGVVYPSIVGQIETTLLTLLNPVAEKIGKEINLLEEQVDTKMKELGELLEKIDLLKEEKEKCGL